jgi:hypothetical protein
LDNIKEELRIGMNRVMSEAQTFIVKTQSILLKIQFTPISFALGYIFMANDTIKK